MITAPNTFKNWQKCTQQSKIHRIQSNNNVSHSEIKNKLFGSESGIPFDNKVYVIVSITKVVQ